MGCTTHFPSIGTMSGCPPGTMCIYPSNSRTGTLSPAVQLSPKGSGSLCDARTHPNPRKNLTGLAVLSTFPCPGLARHEFKPGWAHFLVTGHNLVSVLRFYGDSTRSPVRYGVTATRPSPHTASKWRQSRPLSRSGHRHMRSLGSLQSPHSLGLLPSQQQDRSCHHRDYGCNYDPNDYRIRKEIR